jgi:hypothetical protein
MLAQSARPGLGITFGDARRRYSTARPWGQDEAANTAALSCCAVDDNPQIKSVPEPGEPRELGGGGSWRWERGRLLGGRKMGAAAGSRWTCAFALAVLWVLCCVAGSVVIRARPTSIPEQRNREPLHRRAEILAGMPCLGACGLRNQHLATSGLGPPGTPAGALHRIVALGKPYQHPAPDTAKRRISNRKETETRSNARYGVHTAPARNTGRHPDRTEMRGSRPLGDICTLPLRSASSRSRPRPCMNPRRPGQCADG